MKETKKITLNDCPDCFAVPGQSNILDMVHPVTGLGIYSGKSLGAIQQENPGAVQLNYDKFWAEIQTRENSPITWTITTEERYMEMLECVPPAYWTGGVFLVGEAADHLGKNGVARFSCYAQRGQSYYEASRPLSRAEAAEFGLKRAPLVKASVQPDPRAAAAVSFCAAHPVTEAEEIQSL